MSIRFGGSRISASSAIGLYRSWFANKVKISNIYNSVISINANLGYRYTNGSFSYKEDVIQHALFLKTGVLLYYRVFGFNLSYKIHAARTSKISIEVGDLFRPETYRSLKLRNNPSFYSSIDLKCSFLLRKFLLYIHLQRLDITPIHISQFEDALHIGIEYNISSIFNRKEQKSFRYNKK